MRRNNLTETIQIKYKEGSPHLSMTDKQDWCDLYTYEDVTLHAGDFRIISLGVSMRLPEGYEANIVARSSTFKRWGVIQTNAFAVIDESYCGNDDDWGYPVYATRDVTIPKGTRLCQFRINKKQPVIVFEEVNDLKSPSRNGWGSTGA
jgi:dUTP pyrophosphatase